MSQAFQMNVIFLKQNIIKIIIGEELDIIRCQIQYI